MIWRSAFESGAQMVTGGSIAVKNPEMFTSWISKFGSEKIILGADAKEKKIAISGWEETTQPGVDSFYQRILRQGDYQDDRTDIARDGMRKARLSIYIKEIPGRDPLPFIS